MDIDLDFWRRFLPTFKQSYRALQEENTRLEGELREVEAEVVALRERFSNSLVIPSLTIQPEVLGLPVVLQAVTALFPLAGLHFLDNFYPTVGQGVWDEFLGQLSPSLIPSYYLETTDCDDFAALGKAIAILWSPKDHPPVGIVRATKDNVNHSFNFVVLPDASLKFFDLTPSDRRPFVAPDNRLFDWPEGWVAHFVEI